MTGFVGADVEQLVALSRLFARKADALDHGAAVSASTLMVAEWTGHDIDHLRSEWRATSRPALQRAAQELRLVAADLRKQAEQQRAASRADGGAAPAGGRRPDGEPALTSARDRFDAARGATGDGVRIQAVRGEDGVVRYVVYLRGTDPNSVGLWSIADNASEVGGPSLTGVYIRQKMHEMIPEGAEVMMVGYSQGGIYAQQIASDPRFKVTDVMTFGSPYYDTGSSAANIVRVHDSYDTIPETGILDQEVKEVVNVGDAVVTAWRSILGDDAGAVAHRVEQLNADARHFDILTAAPDVTPALGLGTHADARTYEEGGDQFDAVAQEFGDGRAILASQARYHGTVVSDTGESQ